MGFIDTLPHERGFCRIFRGQLGDGKKWKCQNFKEDIEAEENKYELEWNDANPPESPNTWLSVGTDIPEGFVGTGFCGFRP